MFPFGCLLRSGSFVCFSVFHRKSADFNEISGFILGNQWISHEIHKVAYVRFRPVIKCGLSSNERPIICLVTLGTEIQVG